MTDQYKAVITCVSADIVSLLKSRLHLLSYKHADKGQPQRDTLGQIDA